MCIRDSPRAKLAQKTDFFQQNALQIFTKDWTDLTKIKLHLKGTAFQLKVWQALLKIPIGDISTYTPVSYTHLRAHETVLDIVCRLLLEKKTTKTIFNKLSFQDSTGPQFTHST